MNLSSSICSFKILCNVIIFITEINTIYLIVKKVVPETSKYIRKPSFILITFQNFIVIMAGCTGKILLLQMSQQKS